MHELAERLALVSAGTVHQPTTRVSSEGKIGSCVVQRGPCKK